MEARTKEKRNTFHEALVGPRLGRALRPLNGEISVCFSRWLENIGSKSELSFSAISLRLFLRRKFQMAGAFFCKVIIEKKH
jgi:hypothetical protein